MPRANRQFGHHSVWHITHRCHKKEFLLKFARDRHLWRQWLFEARRRYGLSVLNYVVTSNHIHLMVGSSGKDTIPDSMRLVAGRTAQCYNRRKDRHGAFWEDRYHAVPIDSQTHLIRCMTYVDLNMVRAGVVQHPGQWPWSGYNEIQKPRQRYVVIDRGRLLELLEEQSFAAVQSKHRLWVSERLATGDLDREERWTKSKRGLEIPYDAFLVAKTRSKAEKSWF